MKTLNEIRRKFLDYFIANGHDEVDSSPLVPQNDPTLMFTNAGMVQFKNVFTGLESRPYSKATTAQKCVRAGGKHNDLENVGRTARHHTFFEMLGNFSFGDYFKADAIEMAWHLLTKEYGLSKDKLCVTVYHEDTEALELWQKIAGLSSDKIIKIATSDNFWQMGDTGPCGPCSEIFYDHGEKVWGGLPGSKDEDGDRFIEVWNLVFMQYEMMESGERITLPKPSIDTGMGIERLAAILQNQHDNYDTDLFKALIHASAELSHQTPDGPFKISHRIVADHLRSCAFLIADGVMPSNEGRGYVLRRIMRRAMRHAHLMGCKDPLMHRLVGELVTQMGSHYQQLQQLQTMIETVFLREEIAFRRTLSKGLKLLEDQSATLGEGDVFDGAQAFKLYDTYGFPLDLTQDVLKAKKINVDEQGFDAAMQAQKAKARAAWSGSGEKQISKAWFKAHEAFGATDFLGYSTLNAEGKCQAIISNDQEVSEMQTGQDSFFVILNQTPFYAESGGQVGDQGDMYFDDDKGHLIVKDVKKMFGELWAHEVVLKKGTLKQDMDLKLCVNAQTRSAVQANHSATHLLHAALRQILGDHVSQKGSLVDHNRLRFDFAHTSAVTKDELRQVQDIVNAQILHNNAVGTKLMSPDEAIEAGAMALFGEKYGDEVRVVSMGEAAYSVELCGGTHVERSGDIGLCMITSETAISSGVRRIEAVTGDAAQKHAMQLQSDIQAIAGVLNSSEANILSHVEKLIEERKTLKNTVATLKKQALLSSGGQDAQAVKKIGNVEVLCQKLEGVSAKDLKPMADEFRKKITSGVIVLIAINDEKASIVISTTEDLSATLPATDLVKLGAVALGGTGGGGRPTMAQAGGSNVGAVNEAFSVIENHIQMKVSA